MKPEQQSLMQQMPATGTGRAERNARAGSRLLAAATLLGGRLTGGIASAAGQPYVQYRGGQNQRKGQAGERRGEVEAGLRDPPLLGKNEHQRGGQQRQQQRDDDPMGRAHRDHSGSPSPST